MANQGHVNPFRPGAGHKPPYLAGRQQQMEEFRRLLRQSPILENMVLTGLRGVGKTVLLDEFKPLAINEDWLWAGADLSESASIDEVNFATRMLTDLSVVTSNIVVEKEIVAGMGFHPPEAVFEHRLNYPCLRDLFAQTPGLVADKLKAVLEFVWASLGKHNVRGLIFAYDEAQNMSDHATRGQFPLSLMLDVVQSIQKKNVPIMLVLTGLPTLFPKLVQARTFAERMFRVVFLDRLDEADSRDAIEKPIEDAGCPMHLDEDSIRLIVDESQGYPYFIQFICREVYDAFLQKMPTGEQASVPLAEIIRKLDTDFFAGRWVRATDRQRDLLWVIASLNAPDDEFTVQEVVQLSRELLENPFSASHAGQMLSTLSNAGLVYKNRHGEYSFAVPLLGRYVLRQREEQN